MDQTQLLLTITLSVTTLFLVIVGVQLFLVLRSARKTLGRLNDILDGFERMGLNIEHGWHEVVGFVGGAKVFLKFLDTLQKKRGDKKHG